MAWWGLNDQEALTMASIRNYQAFVQIARFSFLIVLIGFFLALLLTPSFFRSPVPHKTSLQMRKILALGTHLQNVTYHSSHGQRPYVLKATEAHNVGSNTERVRFSNFESVLQGTNQTLNLTARKGLHERQSGTLTLQENVKLRTSNGQTVETPKAVIDLGTKDVKGVEGVSGQGPFGTIQAKEFKLTGDGQKLSLKGGASLSIMP